MAAMAAHARGASFPGEGTPTSLSTGWDLPAFQSIARSASKTAILRRHLKMHSGEKLNKVGLPLGLASIPKHCSIRLQKTFQNAQWKRKKSETNATKICDGWDLTIIMIMIMMSGWDSHLDSPAFQSIARSKRLKPIRRRRSWCSAKSFLRSANRKSKQWRKEVRVHCTSKASTFAHWHQHFHSYSTNQCSGNVQKFTACSVLQCISCTALYCSITSGIITKVNVNECTCTAVTPLVLYRL